ncbi:MAG: hypothetical protein CM1200mP3_15520 [Chloroflexota bacterium]|nr:MAG: hypothetical protein CM1200mP3_15520 [Chloroflexota bacterium]
MFAWFEGQPRAESLGLSFIIVKNSPGTSDKIMPQIILGNPRI